MFKEAVVAYSKVKIPGNPTECKSRSSKW